MTNEISDDAKAYYAGGFKRLIGGVPCKVFARRTTDGRYVGAKDSASYDALYDDPSHGISRLTRDADVIEQARLALDERQAKKPRKPRTVKSAPTEAVEALEAVTATVAAPTPQIAPVAVPAPSGDILARLAAVEAAIGIVAVQPRRTERHAAAIRRAWAMRQAMRERADLDRRALLAANDAYARVEAARAAAVHRAECDQNRAIDAETALALMTDERDEALALASIEETRAVGADRAATALRREYHALEGRADRLARIATSSRRKVATALQDVTRADGDAKAARASERRALGKLSELRHAIDASPTVAKIVDRAIVQAVAA